MRKSVVINMRMRESIRDEISLRTETHQLAMQRMMVERNVAPLRNAAAFVQSYLAP